MRETPRPSVETLRVLEMLDVRVRVRVRVRPSAETGASVRGSVISFDEMPDVRVRVRVRPSAEMGALLRGSVTSFDEMPDVRETVTSSVETLGVLESMV